ncbi:MAG TPA: hypothetical protein PKO09_06165 [Anaerolineae bacterium]|nr:hypothetical protein [Anaerolineae bacterium]
MTYHERVVALAGDAERMEETYRAALGAGEVGAFKEAVHDAHAQSPGNLLLAAWFYRLRDAAVKAKEYAVAWGWALPLAVANGLLLWWLTDDRFRILMVALRGSDRTFGPAALVLAGPIAALFVLAFITAVGRRRWGLSVAVGASLLAAAAYVLLTYRQTGSMPFQQQYLTLMAIHLPLLSWAGVGLVLMARHRDPENRFCFLIKSLEVFILAGLFAIAGGLLTAITAGLFRALTIELPEVVMRLFLAGGAGLIVVVAAAVIYNPAEAPAEQSFEEGLSKLIALLMRVLLPLSLVVLAVYLAFIPFNFRAPFENRDVLIIYNAMLFAVVALLVGATPVRRAAVSPGVGRWLRLGICAVAALATVVSLYALSAIVYRTAMDRLTPNRLAVIGWNVLNIGLLLLLLVLQVRAKEGRWQEGLYRAFRAGTVAYAVWALLMIVALPWLFGVNQGNVEALPLPVQRIVSEQPPPILLKCYDSPHIYLLERGEKRWIDTIETFTERGYAWRDVKPVPCSDLKSIPDGVPIPPDAGSPPQP